MNIIVKVPATSANLGPGFDSLGLALELWNETHFTPAIEFSVQVNGEGAEKLSTGENNLIIRSAQELAQRVGKPCLLFTWIVSTTSHCPQGLVPLPLQS